MEPCGSLGILQLQNRPHLKIPKIFVDRYALDFLTVLEQRSKENHLFPRQMRSSQAVAMQNYPEQSAGSYRSQLRTPSAQPRTVTEVPGRQPGLGRKLAGKSCPRHTVPLYNAGRLRAGVYQLRDSSIAPALEAVLGK
jgi:hypothetical protein